MPQRQNRSGEIRVQNRRGESREQGFLLGSLRAVCKGPMIWKSGQGRRLLSLNCCVFYEKDSIIQLCF